MSVTFIIININYYKKVKRLSKYDIVFITNIIKLNF
jgi:hypothetical protein